MNKYYLPLRIRRDDILKSGFVRPSNLDSVYITLENSDYVNKIFKSEFVEKITSLSDIWGVIIFNLNSNQDHTETYTHTDVTYNNNGDVIYVNSALNIVFDDSTDIPGTMRWYSNKYPVDLNNVALSHANSPYLHFNINDLTLEDEYCISEFVTLVRTNVPHSISSGNQYRTCISIRFTDDFDWNIAVEKFNKLFE
jgi:hypothetical protein